MKQEEQSRSEPTSALQLGVLYASFVMVQSMFWNSFPFRSKIDTNTSEHIIIIIMSCFIPIPTLLKPL